MISALQTLAYKLAPADPSICVSKGKPQAWAFCPSPAPKASSGSAGSKVDCAKLTKQVVDHCVSPSASSGGGGGSSSGGGGGGGNPISWIGDLLGGNSWNPVTSLGQGIWKFASSLLQEALKDTGKLSDIIDFSPSGPLQHVLPGMLWLSIAVALLLGFVQVGRAVMQGGRGFARLFVGLTQYVVFWFGGLAMMGVMIKASDQASVGILGGSTGWDGVWGNLDMDGIEHLDGVGLALVSLLCVVPAAFGLLIDEAVRVAAILFLAATSPLLAATLISDSTRQYAWKGARWGFAAIWSNTFIAIGMSVAEGVAKTAPKMQEGSDQSLVYAFIAGGLLLAAVASPMGGFKLLAFMEPHSVSGNALRVFASRGLSARGGGGGGRGGGGGGAEAVHEGRFRRTMNLFADTQRRSNNLLSMSSGVLDSFGVGHPGGPDRIDWAGSGDGRAPLTRAAGGVAGAIGTAAAGAAALGATALAARHARRQQGGAVPPATGNIPPGNVPPGSIPPGGNPVAPTNAPAAEPSEYVPVSDAGGTAYVPVSEAGEAAAGGAGAPGSASAPASASGTASTATGGAPAPASATGSAPVSTGAARPRHVDPTRRGRGGVVHGGMVYDPPSNFGNWDSGTSSSDRAESFSNWRDETAGNSGVDTPDDTARGPLGDPDGDPYDGGFRSDE